MDIRGYLTVIDTKHVFTEFREPYSLLRVVRILSKSIFRKSDKDAAYLRFGSHVISVKGGQNHIHTVYNILCWGSSTFGRLRDANQCSVWAFVRRLCFSGLNLIKRVRDSSHGRGTVCFDVRQNYNNNVHTSYCVCAQMSLSVGKTYTETGRNLCILIIFQTNRRDCHQILSSSLNNRKQCFRFPCPNRWNYWRR